MLRRGMMDRGHQAEVITPRPFFGQMYRGGPAGKWLGYIDKYLLFPLALRRRAKEFDLVHICDHSNAMYLPHTAGRPASITCHDLLAVFAAEGRYPQQRVSSTGRVQQRWIRKHLRAAARVVCVSQFTAEQFAELGARPDQVRVVIHNPLSYEYSPAPPEAVAAVRTKLGLATAESYLLHVGVDVWYKNRAGAVRIYALLAQELKRKGSAASKLILVGRSWPVEIRRLVAELGLEEMVIECVQPENEELRALYTGARALLFPSLYEGFGWPILEAQSCGCAVITSNRPPMTEVAGEGALYIDPENETQAAQAIAERIESLGDLREAGFRNLKRFDTRERMQQYEEFFFAAAGEQRN